MKLGKTRKQFSTLLIYTDKEYFQKKFHVCHTVEFRLQCHRCYDNANKQIAKYENQRKSLTALASGFNRNNIKQKKISHSD